MLDNFVDAIISNLADLMPFVVVHSYEEGVRWTWGRNPLPLAPGIHRRDWIRHSTEVLGVCDDTLTLPVQCIITKDEKSVCFRVVVGYRVKDIVKHCCNVQDFVESTKALAMGHLAARVREEPLSKLIEDLSKLEKSLKGTLETKFKDWGTEVFMVSFVDFIEAPQSIRLFQDAKIVI